MLIYLFIDQSEPSYYNKNTQQDECQNEDRRSSLGYFYQNHMHAELVYKKVRNLGTEWIGQKQYYTSLFASPQLIQKSFKKCLFGRNRDTEQNHVAINFPEVQMDKSKLNNQIQFDSDFQSGNLFAVYKVGILQYDLLMQNDINTKGNTQWFYFRIKNAPANKQLKINIVNFRKPDSLFNYGMLPCYHSAESEKKNLEGWVRKGTKVQYSRNNHQVQSSKKYYYTLTFNIMTQFPNDTIKIAQCYPYTLTDLNNYFSEIEKVKYKREICHRVTVMNKTLGGNKIQSLIIKDSNLKIKNNQLRPLIILISRQHPGQTPGSFVMEGLIDYFLSKQKDAEFLRKNYQIRAIPMINPDGVQVGNYRTNLYGVDLNRRWDCSTKQRQSKLQGQNKVNIQASQIIHLKKYLSSITKGRQLAFIIDFHGHSRKLYSFFYGNNYPQSPTDVKIFPYICSKLSPMIRYEDCSFNVQEYKRATARVQMLINYKAVNIYTFQASFFGYMTKNKDKKHFTTESYKNLGMIIGKAMYICQKRKQQAIQTKQKLLYDKFLRQLNSNTSLVRTGQGQDSGSQSFPQQCEILQLEKAILQQQFELQKQHSKRLSSTSSKINKQNFKLQNVNSAKQPQKNLRQMQVLDIARVNSIFPNDFLALVPNTFCLKFSKNVKKQSKNVEVQTDPCAINKIDEEYKLSESVIVQECTNQKPFQLKSVSFQRSKPKSMGDARTIECTTQNTATIFQIALKNFSHLSVANRSKSIHQRQLYENARHLSGLKKSTQIRRNLKKILTQHQLSKPKTQFLKSQSAVFPKKNSRHAQTIISFHGELIVKLVQSLPEKDKIKDLLSQQKEVHDQMSLQQSLCESKCLFQIPLKPQVQKQLQKNLPNNLWTIQSKRKSLGIESRQFNTPFPRNQFRKTTFNSKNMIRNYSNNVYQVQKNQKPMQNWQIKKKSLV